MWCLHFYEVCAFVGTPVKKPVKYKKSEQVIDEYMTNLQWICSRVAYYVLRPDVFAADATANFEEDSPAYAEVVEQHKANKEKPYQEQDLVSFKLVHDLLRRTCTFYDDRSEGGSVFAAIGKSASKTEPRHLAREVYDHFVGCRSGLAAHFEAKRRGQRVPYDKAGNDGKPSFASWDEVFETLFSSFRTQVTFPYIFP